MDIIDAKRILEKYEKKRGKKIDIKKNNTNLKNATIENYVTKIKHINKIINNKKVNIKRLSNIFVDNYNLKDKEYIIKKFTYLTDNELIKFLYANYTNENTIKSYLIPYAVICSKIDYFIDNNVYKNIIENIENINKKYENDIDNNSVNIVDNDKLIVNYDEDELDKNIKKIENIEDKVIYALYTYIPPRRLEYSNMIIKTDYVNLDKSHNYIIVENNIPIKFIFNNYKTNKVFGVQIYDIEKKIQELIIKHIFENKKKIDDYLFNYKSNNFGKKITNIFKMIYNADISVRWLRISYTSNIRQYNLTNNELKIISEKMAHSIVTNSRYNKIKMYENV
tara:strand:- start:525 stop:1535 length:1011 start_codon:yes stop_codon:yes gene_type:complete